MRNLPGMNLHRQRGAAAVEFAVLSSLLLIFLAGIVEFGFLWLESHYIANAAREGARVAARTQDPTLRNGKAEQAVDDYLGGLFMFTDKIDDAGFITFVYAEEALTAPDGSALLDTGGNAISGMQKAVVTVTVDTSMVWDPILWQLLEALPFFPGTDYPDDYLTTITQRASFVIEN